MSGFVNESFQGDENKEDGVDVKKEKLDLKKEVKSEPVDSKPDPAALAAAAAAAAKIKELKNAEAELIRDLKAQLKYNFFVVRFWQQSKLMWCSFGSQESSQRPARNETAPRHVQRRR